MAHPIHSQSLSQHPADRIAARFEAAFQVRMDRDQMEPYPALQGAWEEATEYHRTIEVRPYEIPQGGRVRDTICRLFSLFPDHRKAGRMAGRMATAFFYPACSKTAAGTRAFSHLAMLCHAAVREPGQCELRFGEVNPKTHATESQRGQKSFNPADLGRLLNLLSQWPPDTDTPRPPPASGKPRALE